MSGEKHFKLPESLQDVEIKNGIITSGMKITKHNVIGILRGLERKRRKQTLRRCYEVMRKEIFPKYSWRGVMEEMGKHCGKKVDTIRKEVYGRKSLKKSNRGGIIKNKRR